MKVLRSTSLSVAITSLLALSGCSTSSDSVVPVAGFTEAALDGMVSTPADTEPANTGLPGTGLPNNESIVPSGSGVLKLDADYPAMLEALAGYRLESQAEEVMLLGDSAALTAGGSTLLESTTFDVLDRDEVLKPVLIRTSHVCELGGEMIIENGSLLIDEPEYTHRVSLDSYHFDQCRVDYQGEQVLSGSLSVLADYTSGRHFSVRTGQIVWQGFDWQQGSGVSISSNAVIDNYNFNSFDSQQYRNVSIQEFSMTHGSEIVERVDNGDFRQSAESSANGSISDYAMTAAGLVTNASGIAVQVSTDPAISSHMAAAALGLESTFEGQVQMMAEDGSQISLVANRDSDNAVLLVDIDYTSASGSVRSQLAQDYVELPFVAP